MQIWGSLLITTRALNKTPQNISAPVYPHCTHKVQQWSAHLSFFHSCCILEILHCPKKIKEGEGEQSHWTEAEMSAVVVVHQNIEHYCGLRKEWSRCTVVSQEVTTSEFCKQHKVQQSVKKVKYTLQRAKYDSLRRKGSLSFIFFGAEQEGHHNSWYAVPESVAA